MRHGSLFTGIGGFDLAAKWMGWKNIFSCDINPFSRDHSKFHFPSEHYDDIRTVGGGLEEELILSREDSPASLFPAQEKEWERMMTVTSGRRCFELYEKYNQHGSSLKTCVDSLLSSKDWYSSKCNLTWKPMATKCNRFVFQLVPSMRRTEEIGSSLLPTPMASDGMRDSFKRESLMKVQQNHLKKSLTFGMSIVEIILLNLGEKINLSFVEKMMGYPIGWTDSTPWATQSSHK